MSNISEITLNIFHGTNGNNKLRHFLHFRHIGMLCEIQLLLQLISAKQRK